MIQKNKISVGLLLVVSAFMLMVLQSCGTRQTNGRFSPYDLANNKLQGHPTTIEELEYRSLDTVGVVPHSRVLYSYNDHGHFLSSIKIDGKDTIVLSKIDYVDGDFISSQRSVSFKGYSNKYAKNGNLESEKFLLDSSGKTGYQCEYTYNDYGLVLTKISTEFGKKSYKQEYNYNGSILQSSMLTAPDGSYSTNECDSLGNVVLHKEYNKRKRLTSQMKTSYVYDSNGNWISKEVYTKTYKQRQFSLSQYVVRNYTYLSSEEIAHAAATAKIVVTDSKGETHLTWTFYVCMAFWAILFIALVFIAYAVGLFDNFWGKTLDNGMRKMWMYNSRSYTRFVLLVIFVALSFIAAVLLVLLLGLAGWCLALFGKYLLIVLIWIGYAAAIIGVLCLFAKEWGAAIPLIIIGGPIVMAKDTIRFWSNAVGVWGEDFKEKLNLAAWAIQMFTDYGRYLVAVMVILVTIFLSFALLLIVISLILRGYEIIVMRRYNLKHECPNCGNKEKFDYLVKRREGAMSLKDRTHPVLLRPGVYGILHQTNPKTGERLPTMILNGKGELSRRCPHCGQEINDKNQIVTGTSVHVGIAGVRSSGKSYLLYSGLKHMKNKYGSSFNQIDIDQNDIDEMYARIKDHDGIQTAVKDLYKAIQVMLDVDGRPYPYHLYFYDVAGEKYDTNSSSSNTAMDTYSNIKTIVFVIDPTSVDTTQLSASSEFEEWQQKRDKDGERYDVGASFMLLYDILQSKGREKKGKVKGAHLMFVCTKADLGYLKAVGINDKTNSNLIKSFMTEHLGLDNLVIHAENMFDSISYRAVSVWDENDLDCTFSEALKKAGADLK